MIQITLFISWIMAYKCTTFQITKHISIKLRGNLLILRKPRLCLVSYFSLVNMFKTSFLTEIIQDSTTFIRVLVLVQEHVGEESHSR